MESQDTCALSELASGMGQSANKRRRFSQAERATYKQTDHPCTAGSFKPETAVSSAELTRSICELADPDGYF